MRLNRHPELKIKMHNDAFQGMEFLIVPCVYVYNKLMQR